MKFSELPSQMTAPLVSRNTILFRRHAVDIEFRKVTGPRTAYYRALRNATPAPRRAGERNGTKLKAREITRALVSLHREQKSRGRQQFHHFSTAWEVGLDRLSQ